MAAGVEEAQADEPRKEDKYELAQAQAAVEAANDVQDSGDMKDAGETDNEEQEAEEKGGEVKGQAEQTTTAESDGGCARPLSPPPIDRTHHSPSGKRRMSDEEEQEEAKQPKSPGKEDVQQAEQHGSGGEGVLRMYMTQAWTEEESIQCGGSAGGWRESQADSERRRVATHERRW